MRYNLAWGLALPYCGTKLVFSGLTLEVWPFSLPTQCSGQNWRFPRRNLPICADEMIDMLLISCADSCAGSPGIWRVSYVTVATADRNARPAHRLILITFTVCSLQTFIKRRWLSVGANSSAWRNSEAHLCFVRTSMWGTILLDCSPGAICRTTTKLLAVMFSLYCHTTSIRL
jgi:hypothetical protein